MLIEKEQPGTYAAACPDQNSANRLVDFMTKHQIQNPEPADKLHCTILYSRKHLPNYVPMPKLTFVAIPTSLEIWPESGKNILVLKFDSPGLQARHKELMNTHQATWDYPDYKTHITLSYDAGDIDIKTLDYSMIAKPIIFTNEYQEDLDLTGK